MMLVIPACMFEVSEDLYEVFLIFVHISKSLWWYLCIFSLDVLSGSILWKVFLIFSFFMDVCLWGFEEVYLRYLFRYYVMAVSPWVCVHDDWRNGCFVSLWSVYLASVCFSQKFAKGGDCWVFVLASLLLKQIFLYDVGYGVPTSWHGSVCTVCMAWFSQASSF